MQKTHPPEWNGYNGEHRSNQAERAGMESKNASLQRAAKAKADEFYTQLPDIEAELKHYKEHFKGKKILCNCDDPFESNFFKYFAMNFNHLGLAKLTATSYVDSPIAEGQLPLFEVQGLGVRQGEGKKPYKMEISEVHDEDGNQAIDLADVEYLLKNRRNSLSLLEGDGDFRSPECIELLKDADIVVTNPPFSLFREYVAQLVEFNKKFIIIGNKNSITYKEIFSLIKAGQLWLGYRNINQDMWFIVPEDYDFEKVVDGKRLKHIMGCWFTNLDTTKLHETLTLYCRYEPEAYPHYDNYDAINVDKVAEIPYDFDGVMGVPITFLDKYNPSQFEIMGSDSSDDYPPTKRYPRKDKIVDRIRMKSKTGTMGCVIREADFGSGTYFDVGYPVRAVYKRIFIRRKQVGQ